MPGTDLGTLGKVVNQLCLASSTRTLDSLWPGKRLYRRLKQYQVFLL